VGAEILGATTLQDFGLALFIGLLSGAYSSIFIAAPILALLKEREPRYRAIRQRLERSDSRELLTPAMAASVTPAGVAPSARGSAKSAAARPVRSGPLRPGVAAQNAARRAALAAEADQAAAREEESVSTPEGPTKSGSQKRATPGTKKPSRAQRTKKRR
jgi:preprotein translocase subunit SecF